MLAAIFKVWSIWGERANALQHPQVWWTDGHSRTPSCVLSYYFHTCEINHWPKEIIQNKSSRSECFVERNHLIWNLSMEDVCPHGAVAVISIISIGEQAAMYCWLLCTTGCYVPSMAAMYHQLCNIITIYNIQIH